MKTIRMLQIIGPAFAMAISGLAQETLNYGTINGVVADPSGAVIDGAAITARQTEINLTAQATTDAVGRFRLRYLRVGPYEITVHQSGFEDAKRALTLTIGSAFNPGEFIALRHAMKNYLGRDSGLAGVIRAVVEGSLVPVGYQPVSWDHRVFVPV